jgi:hypothetical protein
MKKIIVLMAVALVFISCDKDTYQYKDEGEITGANLSACPTICCGGWFIKIKETTYGFDQLPAGSNINLQTAKFPVKVKLDWTLTNLCNNTRITITKIKKI